MEIEGDLKSMTTMLKELTLDVSNPTLAVLGSKDGGGKLMIGITKTPSQVSVIMRLTCFVQSHRTSVVEAVAVLLLLVAAAPTLRD